jgi:NAD(P)-dependent dehydrogenase (short-subunit alcohol dehydrogenase family)
VRVNAIAPVARTRLTLASPGPIGEMMKAPEDPDAFDAFHPKHVAPLVGYLASADCPITGKVFAVQGGAIQELRGWQIGEGLRTEGDWTIAGIAGELAGAPA